LHVVVLECVDDEKKKFNYRRATFKSNGDIKQYKNWDKRKNKRCAILAKETFPTILEACTAEITEICKATCNPYSRLLKCFPQN